MVSKYLLVLHDDSASDTIVHWLDARRSSLAERWTTRLNRTYSLTLVAPDVRGHIDGRTFTTGVMVDQASATVTFGPDVPTRGRRSTAASSPSGAFLRAGWTRDELTIEHDVFGAVPLLQAHGPGFVAFSDSLLVLSDLRGRFGLVNTPNVEVLLARSGTTTRTSQNLGIESTVREITTAPPATRFVVDCRRPVLVAAVGESFAARVSDIGDPLAALRRAAGFLVGSVRALAARDDAVVRISGGRDSGLLLGAAVRAGVQDDVRFETDAGPELDDAVTRGAAHGVAVTAASDRRAVPHVSGWAGSGLGLYDGIRSLDTDGSPERTRLVVDAIGAKLLRPPWTRGDVATLRAGGLADDPASSVLAAQLNAGIRALGCDPDDDAAAVLQYAAYRSGVHAAASSGAVGVALHPLQLLDSVAAAATPLASVPDLGAFDAVEALLGSGAAGSAADARGALTLSEIGGPLDDGEIPDVRLSGSTTGLQRSTVLATEIAASHGLSGEENPAYLADLAQGMLEALPTELRDAYEPLVDNARWQLVERRTPVDAVGPSLAKLLALTVFTT